MDRPPEQHDASRIARATLGMVFALLVALAGITGFSPGEAGAWPSPAAAPSACANASASDSAAEPSGLGRDQRERRAELERAVLETKAEDDDDDTHPDTAAAAPTDRPAWSSSGAHAAWPRLPSVGGGQLLISTGLARGPPTAA